jgi:FtsP/CotA-like multicopper oxidase with cupredoxin domain
VTLHDETKAPQRSTEDQAALGADLLPRPQGEAGGGSDAPAWRRPVSRRAVLQVGASGAGLAAFYAAHSVVGPSLDEQGLASADGVFGAASIELADALYTEVFPTSPLILSPFKDELPIPEVLKPSSLSGAGKTKQSNMAKKDGSYQAHQCWSDDERIKASNGGVAYPEPVQYHLPIQVAEHAFTKQKVLPINAQGQPAVSFDKDGKSYPAGTQRDLPPSTIYGFNGQFPGPAIHARYGQPALVRFDNQLDQNPNKYPTLDFGAPDKTFLTHLHNGHTAPESDGNPHYFFDDYKDLGVHGYGPGTYCDNLYLNWPAGGDDAEKQSFFWFHDHRMDQTGSNVYKGMVGLYPIYDPKDYSGDPAYPGVKPGGLDDGDETKGLQLPGVPRGDGGIDYDIPLTFFDARLDDGVTTHHDMHDSEYIDENGAPIPGNLQHPEWWGKTFYKHFPNHGFVGDLFTVNGTAYPVLKVKRRKYRFRFLDCSLARIYEFKLMTSAGGPKAAKDLGLTGDELQGQYRIPDGEQSMQFLQIASDGGLLPKAVTRDSFELWPAKRREFVIDFRTYGAGAKKGQKTKSGELIYLTDVMKMPTGRMWSNSSRFSSDPKYKVPVMAFQIDGDEDAPDSSNVFPGKPLRPLPEMKLKPGTPEFDAAMKNRLIFEVQRGSGGGEVEWLINGQTFDPSTPVTSLKNPAGNTPKAVVKKDSYALWEIRNGGGGWVHPFHLHMEEHRTVMRNGKLMINPDGSQKPDASHPDDGSREDLVALDPSESTIIYRQFRDFEGHYVAHCHNLAHEDHAMMFGWTIEK